MIENPMVSSKVYPRGVEVAVGVTVWVALGMMVGVKVRVGVTVREGIIVEVGSSVGSGELVGVTVGFGTKTLHARIGKSRKTRIMSRRIID
jgi:hypothetical protein